MSVLPLYLRPCSGLDGLVTGAKQDGRDQGNGKGEREIQSDTGETEAERSREERDVCKHVSEEGGGQRLRDIDRERPRGRLSWAESRGETLFYRNREKEKRGER